MKEEWTNDVSDIPTHVLENEIEKRGTGGYLKYEVDFYRKHGYATRKRKPIKYKDGVNTITGHLEAGIRIVGSGTLKTNVRDRSLNGNRF